MATWGVESELRAAVASWAALSTRAGFFFAWLATESVGAVSKIAWSNGSIWTRVSALGSAAAANHRTPANHSEV